MLIIGQLRIGSSLFVVLYASCSLWTALFSQCLLASAGTSNRGGEGGVCKGGGGGGGACAAAAGWCDLGGVAVGARPPLTPVQWLAIFAITVGTAGDAALSLSAAPGEGRSSAGDGREGELIEEAGGAAGDQSERPPGMTSGGGVALVLAGSLLHSLMFVLVEAAGAPLAGQRGASSSSSSSNGGSSSEGDAPRAATTPRMVLAAGEAARDAGERGAAGRSILGEHTPLLVEARRDEQILLGPERGAACGVVPDSPLAGAGASAGASVTSLDVCGFMGCSETLVLGAYHALRFALEPVTATTGTEPNSLLDPPGGPLLGVSFGAGLVLR